MLAVGLTGHFTRNALCFYSQPTSLETPTFSVDICCLVNTAYKCKMLLINVGFCLLMLDKRCLTHASNDAMHWKTTFGAFFAALFLELEGGVLLLGDADVEAHV